MAFPFWWIGGLTAALLLGAAFVLFVLLDRLLVRSADSVRSAMLPGLVTGFRTWTIPRDPPAAMSPAGGMLEELPGPGTETLERVRRGH
jgi:hypothetical protein